MIFNVGLYFVHSTSPVSFFHLQGDSGGPLVVKQTKGYVLAGDISYICCLKNLRNANKGCIKQLDGILLFYILQYCIFTETE